MVTQAVQLVTHHASDDLRDNAFMRFWRYGELDETGSSS